MFEKKITKEKVENDEILYPKDLSFQSYLKSCFGEHAIKILGGTFLAGFIWSKYRMWKDKCKDGCI